jgi:hypothetical protein
LDAKRFDSLTRTLGEATSRRGIAKTLAGATLAALAAPLGIKEAAADCSGEGGSCKKKNKCCSGLKCNNKDKCKYKNSCGGKQGDYCQNNGDCCNNLKCKNNKCK